jgi:hypothetical protein
MSRSQKSKIKLPIHLERVLHETEIDYERGPGTILRDFDAFLNYLSERRLRVTDKHQLPLQALPEINARLVQPIEQRLKRPKQKSFPPVHGLYLIVRASGLTFVDNSGSKPCLLIDEEVQQAWQRLNPAEQYGNLLASWLLHGKPEIVGERSFLYDPFSGHIRSSHHFISNLPDEGLPIAGNFNYENALGYNPGWQNLGLLSLFGCIDIRHGTPIPGERWQIERIYRTPFGEALFALLLAEFLGNIEKIMGFLDEERIPVGMLQSILQPYFPKWDKNLVIAGQSSREGVHIFRLSFGRSWRRIALPADGSLDALAIAILDSIHFDYDHLYEFSYRNRFGVVEQFCHPRMGQGPWADEVSVGELPIGIGQTMTFLYDFGDEWEFKVTFERVDPDMKMDKPDPVVIESHGEPPVQYPQWGDDADEWEDEEEW